MDVISFFFFKQKTAYEMRISDWSSDVCSSDLTALVVIGSRRTTFGRIDSTENYKPVLYCSVAKDAQGRAIDNENCVFGLVTGTSARRSLESSLLDLRSGRGCTFAGAVGTGFSSEERLDGNEGVSKCSARW